MIAGFRHRGLRRLYESGDPRGIKQEQVKRLRRILALLENAGRIEDVGAVPGLRLHALSGNLQGFWSVTVSGNWRLVFRFEGGDAYDVDLLDYH